MLRAAAAGLAVTGVVDPACTRQLEMPLPVLVRSSSTDAANVSLADRVREGLATRLEHRIDVEPAATPRAIVVTGGQPIDGETLPDDLPDDVPVSIVTDGHPSGRNVGIVSATTPPLLAGWPGTIAATVVATRAAGESSVITLEHEGLELGRIDHRWTADAETFEARFDHVPPAAGIRPVRMIAQPLDGELTLADNHADLRLLVEDRPLNVLVHEPRPSWTTTFVRRALEQEPRFDVSALARASRGIEVRAGAAPERLRPESLDPFDVVVAGAPEELGQEEIDALLRFARVRGGTIVFAPDRGPSGAYTKLVPVASFEERLFGEAVAVRGSVASLRASELAVPVGPGSDIDVLAGLERRGRIEPIVFAWPVGAGQAIFSGALDAWRYRAREGEFGAFWRAHIAAAAIASPRPVEAILEPGIAAPGQVVTLRVHVRATEAESRPGVMAFPSVSARLIGPDGSIEPVRLWPVAEAGLFEGRVPAPGAGRYAVQVSAGRATFDTALVVSGDVRTAAFGAPRTLELLARSSGGVIVRAADLDQLEAHLAALDRPSAARSIHPARSPWWMAGFGLLLCAEWGLRRRRGLS